MSSDSESKVVVAGSSAEDIVQREKLCFGNIFGKRMIQSRNARIVTANLKLALEHVHPNIRYMCRKKN